MQARLGKLPPFPDTPAMNPWLILILAGLLEVCWATSLKATAGFTRLGPTVFFAVSLAASMFLLSLAARQLPVGVAYAVWVGIGAAGTALTSVFILGESFTLVRGAFLALLIVSIVGLKLSSHA
jgi:quaternary ammonium compound-resistance protein SugE